MNSRIHFKPAFTRDQIRKLCESTRITESTQEILYAYYNDPGASQQEIASKFGIVHARVSQAVIRFEEHIQTMITDKKLHSYTGFYTNKDLKTVKKIDQYGSSK